ncbi:hypothetical protein [Rhizobium leguminosarum]|uniref:hypothetical protein n=1 Tax=Rhizobium leguminosarum TaxID=384 RepID=UPI003F9CBED3
MLRIVAITANALLLLFIGYMMAQNGWPRRDDIPLLLLMIIAPVFSLLAMLAQDTLKVKAPELLTLELEARKAKLRKQIAEAGGDATRAP